MLLRPGQLSLDELQAIHAGGQPLMIDPAALPGMIVPFKREVYQAVVKGFRDKL